LEALSFGHADTLLAYGIFLPLIAMPYLPVESFLTSLCNNSFAPIDTLAQDSVLSLNVYVIITHGLSAGLCSKLLILAAS
jgi:hypothetical protein